MGKVSELCLEREVIGPDLFARLERAGVLMPAGFHKSLGRVLAALESSELPAPPADSPPTAAAGA